MKPDPNTPTPAIRPDGSRPRERRTEGRGRAAADTDTINTLLLHAAAEQATMPLFPEGVAELMAVFRDTGDFDLHCHGDHCR